MNRRHFTRTLALSAAASALPYQARAASSKLLVYFGPYTNAKSGSKGIYRATSHTATGDLTEPVLASETASPSFIEIHPSKKYLYAVGEMGDAKQKGGAVSAFAISLPSGDLTLINQVSSVGAGPCHVNIDKTGKVAGVANYSGGSCTSYQIKDDGSLSEAASFHQHAGKVVDPKRQGGPHAHSVNYSPDGRFAFVCDLGLDKVFIYKVDTATGKFEPHGEGIVPPRSGPRHLAWHPSGKSCFVNNEILLTCTVFAYDVDKGALTALETVSCLPKDQAWEARFSTAETRVHPNGKLCMCPAARMTRSRASALMKPPASSHTSAHPERRQDPRNFNITPDGQWLLCAHQDTGNVVVFRVDAATGDLRPTGKEAHVGGCVCIRFLSLD